MESGLDAYLLAYQVATLSNQLFGKGNEPHRQQAYTNPVKFVTLLPRFADRNVTLQDACRAVLKEGWLAEQIQAVREVLDFVPEVWTRAIGYSSHAPVLPAPAWQMDDCTRVMGRGRRRAVVAPSCDCAIRPRLKLAVGTPPEFGCRRRQPSSVPVGAAGREHSLLSAESSLPGVCDTQIGLGSTHGGSVPDSTPRLVLPNVPPSIATRRGLTASLVVSTALSTKPSKPSDCVGLRSSPTCEVCDR